MLKRSLSIISSRSIPRLKALNVVLGLGHPALVRQNLLSKIRTRTRYSTPGDLITRNITSRRAAPLPWQIHIIHSSRQSRVSPNTCELDNPSTHASERKSSIHAPLPAEPLSVQIYPLRSSPLVHSPLITDLRHRHPDRRVQSQRSAHRHAGLALCAIEGFPQEVGDGRTAGDE